MFGSGTSRCITLATTSFSAMGWGLLVGVPQSVAWI